MTKLFPIVIITILITTSLPVYGEEIYDDYNYLDNEYNLLGYNSEDIEYDLESKSFLNSSNLERLYWNFNNKVPEGLKEKIGSLEDLLDLCDLHFPTLDIRTYLLGKDFMVIFMPYNSGFEFRIYIGTRNPSGNNIVRDRLFSGQYVDTITFRRLHLVTFFYRDSFNQWQLLSRGSNPSVGNYITDITERSATPKNLSYEDIRKSILYSTFPIYTDPSNTILFYGGGPQLYNLDDLHEGIIRLEGITTQLIENQYNTTQITIMFFGVILSLLCGSLFFKLVFRDVK